MERSILCLYTDHWDKLKNAEFQARSGIETTIERMSTASCCEWCVNLEGKYSCPDNVPNDVYHRHRDCRCLVAYKTGDGRTKNVHSKKWVDPDEYEQIE